MLEMINSNVVERVSDIKKRYPNCMLEVLEYNDDFNGTVTAKLYAVSHDEDSYDDICDLNNKLFREGYNCSLIGDYDGGYSIDLRIDN